MKLEDYISDFNVANSEEFKKKRIKVVENSKCYNGIFNGIYLPCNMEDLDNDIDLWLEDNSYKNDFGGDGFNTNNSSYYKKMLSNKWDLIVDWSINLGNNHFAITINTPENYTNRDLSSYDNYTSDDYNKIINKIVFVFKEFFKTTTFIFIAVEKNKKGNIHFHILVGIRNFIDYDYCIKNNLSNLLKINTGTEELALCDYDIKVQSLKKFKDIKNWSMYLYKDMYLWKFPACIFVIEKYYQNIFIDSLGNITDFYLIINMVFISYKNINVTNVDLDNLCGIVLNDNTLNQRTLINLIQYFLILKEYYLYNGNIYTKIENSLISYRLVGSVEEILYNKFQENIVVFFTSNFEYYFLGFDFNRLITNYIHKSKNIINSIIDVTTNRINLDFSVIEFRDGIYFIKYDRFIPKKELKKIENNLMINTIKYYDKKYNTIRRKEPKVWIKGLLRSLNITEDDFNSFKNIDKFTMICLYLINIFHKNIFKKMASLSIYGKSNTRKSTLISEPVSYFVGKENVGSIVTTKNFKLQELKGKIVGILDEFKYDSSISGDFLKLLGGEGLIVEKKYSKEHVSIDNIPIIIISNNPVKDKDENINKALENRIFSVEFFNPISEEEKENNIDYSSLIKEEEVNIILYCNKVYFENINNNKNLNIKKISKKYSNIKFIENYSKK